MTGEIGDIVLVTGTGTGVGKTIATAALAAQARVSGRRVVAVKPVQTGTADGDCDAAEITRLSGVETHEYTRLDEPLAPDIAARRAGITLPAVATYAERITGLAKTHDLVLVEGAGGLLVRLDTDNGTLLQLGEQLRTAQPTPPARVWFMVVTAAELGTLNHTELTVTALRAHDFEPLGLIIGSAPNNPGLAERCNLKDLPRTARTPLLGIIDAGASHLDRAAFQQASATWFQAIDLTNGLMSLT